MKYTNDKLDQALDHLYDVLSKSPEGTGFVKRILRYERFGVKMPKAYEKMRDKFQSEGLSKKAAQAKAAKIYNASGKGHVGKGSR